MTKTLKTKWLQATWNDLVRIDRQVTPRVRFKAAEGVFIEQLEQLREQVQQCLERQHVPTSN